MDKPDHHTYFGERDEGRSGAADPRLSASSPRPGEAPDDLTILKQVAQGDLKWFDQFVDRYSERLLAYFYSKKRDHHTAEELTQEVLLAIVRAARGNCFDDRSRDLSAWIFTIANHRLIDHHRKHARDRARLDSDTAESASGFSPIASHAASSVNPADDAIRDEETAMLFSVIDQLPASQQEVLQLKVFGGLTFSAIALLLKCPEGTVKTRMRLALMRVREFLSLRGIDA